jgi:WD40 repeat protein
MMDKCYRVVGLALLVLAGWAATASAQAPTLPIEEHFTNGTFDQTWFFDTSFADGTEEAFAKADSITIADSTGSPHGGYVGVFHDGADFGNAHVGPELTDYSVEASIFIEVPFDNSKFPRWRGIVVRADTSNSSWYRLAILDANSLLRFQVWSGSGFKLTTNWTFGTDLPAITESGWHTLKVTAKAGNSTEFYIFFDGELLPGSPIVDPDDTIPMGFAGIHGWGPGPYQVIFDDFIISEANTPPVADAGADQNVVLNGAVTLDGTGSSDAEGDPLTYAWSVVSAPEAVALDDPTSATPSFTPTTTGEFVFRLLVNDGTDNGRPDTVKVAVFESQIAENWWVEFAGSNRHIGVDPRSGRAYITQTGSGARKAHFFNFGNETGTPDGAFQDPAWDAWLGPYGADVADDGMLYVAVWTGTKGVYQVDHKGNIRLIADIGQAIRGLTAVGGGANTVVYVLENGGALHKLTTTDGVTFTDEVLFQSGDNASVTASSDGSTIYTVGFKTPIHKWDAAGNPDTTTFVEGLAAEGQVTSVRLAKDDSTLYAFYSAEVISGTDTTLVGKIAKVNGRTGAIISETIVGPPEIYGSILSLDLLDDHQIYWTSSAGYRGLAMDVTTPFPNHAPYANAGFNQTIQAGTEVTLDGSWSVDIDGDQITYMWTVVSSPEPVVLSDATAEMPTFTPNTAGDYVFELVVNDGVLDSAPDTTVVSVFSKDLFLTFDDAATIDEELASWDGDLDEDGASDAFTAVGWDTTGGIEGGALDIRDGGFGLAIERSLRTTAGTTWSLSAYVKVVTSTGATPGELYLQVVGNVPEPVKVDIKDATDWTKVELSGFSIADGGELQVVGSMPFQAGVLNHVLIDSLIFDDEAPLATVTVSGTVTLGDNPADMSGSIVSLVGFEPYLADTTDAAGAYAIPNVLPGTYDILATHFGYKDSLVASAVVRVDTTVDFTLALNQPPVADAGTDQTGVTIGTVVQLDGTGSSDPDGDELTYMWKLIAFPEVDDALDTTIIGADQAVAMFRPMAAGTYSFELIVNDGTVDSDPDSVQVTADVPAPFDYVYEDKGEFPGAATNVHGVAVDPEGKVWIGSFGGSSYLVVKNPDGSDASFSPVEFGLIGTDTVSTLNRNRGIEVGPDGNIYVSTSISGGVGILKFDYRTGEPLGGIARSASPTKVGVDGNGNIFVSDVVAGDSRTIDIYDSNFQLVGTIDASPAAGLPAGIISRAVDVSADGSTVILADIVNGGRLYKFTGSVGGGYTYDGEVPGPFYSVQGINFDGQGRLWAGDYVQLVDDKQFVHIYDPDLNFRTSFVVDLFGPRGFGFANEDSLVYIIGFDGHEVKRFAIPGFTVPTLLTPLADARENDDNGQPVLFDQVVRVRGIVTVADEFAGDSRRGPAYLQAPDGSAGIAVFSADFVNAVARGDEVVVEGKVGFFRGLTEIVDPLTVEVLSQNNSVDPLDITTADLADTLGETYEGVLVRIRGVTVNTTMFEGNKNYTITDETGSTTMRIDRDTDIPGSEVVADTFDVVGVVGQFDSSEPYWSGYQVLPRDKFDLAEATSVDEEGGKVPRRFALYQNYPNPFNPSTTIQFDVPKQAQVRITIYNVLGQQVRSLVDKQYSPGSHSVIWDARNDAGQRVSSGLYFYMIEAGKKDSPRDFVKVLQMTLLK